MKKSTVIIAIISAVLFFGFKPAVEAADLYANYQALSAARRINIDYKIASRQTASTTAVIAIHGGSIEPGTTELADNIAGSRYDYYSFNGTMSSNNSVLHITSTRFNEPGALELVAASSKTLSIHGFSSTTRLTYVGGIDKTLVARVKARLKAAGFRVADAPTKLAGQLTTNITNRNLRKAGVQIEVSSAQRASFFKSLTTSGRTSKTTTFYKYTNAIKAALAY